MTVIRLLGLNFSPRQKSNSGAILREAFGKAAAVYGEELDYEIIDLKDVNFENCQYCDVCGKTKDTGEFIPCKMKDRDDLQHLLDLMIASDGFVVATPVYFGMPSDLFSKFIMRTRVLRHQDFALANRTVGIISIAGRRSGGGETAILTAWLPFIRHGCLIVGNGDKTCQFGTAAWAGGREHVLSDEWGLEQAYQTVERAFHVARLTREGITSLNYKSPMTFCYKSGMRP
jgi:multimeric flavodoxin WrbA